jgi:ubiquinone biosynthesis protein COQ9
MKKWLNKNKKSFSGRNSWTFSISISYFSNVFHLDFSFYSLAIFSIILLSSKLFFFFFTASTNVRETDPSHPTDVPSPHDSP